MTNNTDNNSYTTLGLTKNATPDEIKKAYRKLVLTAHPDKGGNPDTFDKIQQAYDTLTGGSTVTIESLHVPLEAFDAFDAAIDNCDLTTLDKLYEQFPITFSDDYVIKAFTHLARTIDDNRSSIFNDFFTYPRASARNVHTLEERVKTLLWLLNHDAEGNISIRLSVTLTQRDHIDTVRDGVVINTRYEDYSKQYDWETTLLGFAMFHKQSEFINGLVKIPGIRLEDILIPSSAKREEYATGLEYSAQRGWFNAVVAYLDKQRCQMPKIQELGNAIYNARQKHNYAIANLLAEYRSKHYRYNPFKFGYNQEWHDNVDTSWQAVIKELPTNFRIAFEDFIDICKYIYNIAFSWEGLYNAAFASLAIVLTGLFVSAYILSNHYFAFTFGQDLLNLGLTIIGCGTAVLLIDTYNSLRQPYLNFMHKTFDPLFERASDFINDCLLKIKNFFAIFTKIKSAFASKPKDTVTPENIVEPMEQSHTVPKEYDHDKPPVIFSSLQNIKQPYDNMKEVVAANKVDSYHHTASSGSYKFDRYNVG